MVKANIKNGKPVKAGKKVNLFKMFTTNKKFQDKTLLNTANRWASKGKGFDGDITYSKISSTGKSVHIKVDGKELTSKYVVMGSEINPVLISGKAIARSN